MTPSNRHAILELVRFGDIGLLFGCLGVAYATIFHLSANALLDSLETRHPIQVFLATLLLAFGWHATLRSHGFYRSHRLDNFLKETLDICSASTLCVLLCFLWLVLVAHPAARHIIDWFFVAALFGVLSAVAFTSTRFSSRAFMYNLRARGHNLRHVIIVGTNRRADGFARDIDLHPEWGYRLHGFVDEQWYHPATSDDGRHPLLGSFDDLPTFLRTMPVDEVMVALPIASFYRQVSTIVGLCRHHGIVVRSIGSFFEQDRPSRNPFLRGAVGTITLHDESWSVWASLIKRFIDVTVSFVLLVALSPILLLITLLIKLTSPGPVFFIQTRMGYGKRPFQILKFRTMVVNAEQLMARLEHLNETQGPTFKLKNDPRITPIGKFLRKTSLDEIPQLINVLVGDMSLVGPRPLPLRDYQGFSEDWHRRRFSVKPGITCLWQVMGRSSIGFEEWMALDMRYIDQWSVWLDFKILFQTIPAVFRGSGAV